MAARDPTHAGRLVTDLILEVFRLNGRLLRTGDRLSRPAGQTSARWQVLGAAEDEPRSVAAIARGLGLTRQSVQRIADRLETDGLVTFLENPAHRRARLVALTGRGRSAFDWITRRQVAWANYVGQRVGEANIDRTLKGLRAFGDVLDRSPIPRR